MLVSGAAETSVAARTAAMMPAARDVDGQEFADDNAAIQEARAVARDLSHNRNPSSQERVVVTNEKGDVVHEEPLFRA